MGEMNHPRREAHGMGGDDWRREASCLNHDPEIWFPVQRADGYGVDKAKRICGACPVRSQCLTFALENPFICGLPLKGIWGGLTEKERRLLRRGDKRRT